MSTSVQFRPIRFITSAFVLFGLVRSYSDHSPYSVHFRLIRSTLVHFSPFSSIWSILIYSSLFWSILVHFDPLITFSPFLYIYIMAKDKFELREPILNPNLLKKYIDLKLIISKIVSITLIVTTLLLSHINVAFQSILV